MARWRRWASGSSLASCSEDLRATRKCLDNRLAWFVATVETLPTILVVALIRALEPTFSVFPFVIAVGLVRWAEVASLLRTGVLRADASEYALAASAIGADPSRMVLRHLLPNAMGPALISSAFGIGSVVLLETALSFLDFGRASAHCSWGEILAEGALHADQPRLLLLPGTLLVAAVGSSYLMASALRDAAHSRR